MDDRTLYITEIQRFSIHDGPGLRTTVFLKGCNLRCAWCHNPETQSAESQIQYFARKCLKCGSCISACPAAALSVRHDRIGREAARCISCGRCVDACPSNAMHWVGRELDLDELLAVLQKDRDVFPDFSGVTFSGGEPMLQSRALMQILPAVKSAGHHVAIDTAGDVPWSSFWRILPFTDLFLFDIKLMNSETHKFYTGRGNGRILENLTALCRHSRRLWIRLPLVRGGNDTEENVQALRRLLDSLPGAIERIDLLPYHAYGQGKAESLQMQQDCFTPPTSRRLAEIRAELQPYAAYVY